MYTAWAGVRNVARDTNLSVPLHTLTRHTLPTEPQGSVAELEQMLAAFFALAKVRLLLVAALF